MALHHTSAARPVFARGAIALACASCCVAPAALGGPVGHVVVAGQAQVTQPTAQNTIVTQSSDKAILNWTSFNIGSGERVEFRQPGSASVALNRVTGGGASVINGQLSANGKVFLVNPDGVLFGQGAVVDVGALVASSLDISDADFLAGAYRFTGTANVGAAVNNDGLISAAERGTVALLGGQVRNTGTISARLGTAILAAGSKVTLDFNGDGLTRISVDAAAIDAAVNNGGAVLADGGMIIMRASDVSSMFNEVLRHTGVAQARSLVEREGRIILDGGGAGTVLIDGQVDASGAAGLRGGAVDIIGATVTLGDAARLDASGGAGGGRVSVGGTPGMPAYTGASLSVNMGSGAVIGADATGDGAGGQISLWAESQTGASGQLSARGAGAGAGGSIVVGGGEASIEGLRVEASAPAGAPGVFTFTQPSINVDTGLAATVAQVLDTGTSVTLDTVIAYPYGAAPGDIVVASDIVKQAGADTRLLMNAQAGVRMPAGVVIASRNNRASLQVDMNADASGLVASGGALAAAGGAGIELGVGAAIESNGGDVRLYGQSDALNGYARGGGEGGGGAGVLLFGARIDTRRTQGAPGASDTGAIGIGGWGVLQAYPGQSSGSGVVLRNSALRTAGGAIGIRGVRGAAPPDGVTPFAPLQGIVADLGEGAAIVSIGGAVDMVADGGMRLNVSDGGELGSGAGPVTLRATNGAPGGAALRIDISNADVVAGGDLTLSGVGGRANNGVDITLSSGSLASTGGRLVIDGVSGSGGSYGVRVQSVLDDEPNGALGSDGFVTGSTGLLRAERGIAITGTAFAAGGPSNFLPFEMAGVRLSGVELRGGGDVSIKGVAVGAGLYRTSGAWLEDSLIGGGAITVLGAATVAGPGLSVDGTTIGGAGQTSDIVIGARSADAPASLAYRQTSRFANQVQTAGAINLRPDDQGVNIGGLAATALPIGVGQGGMWNVAPEQLGIGSDARLVIGSAEHTGLITWNQATPWRGNLTLQNDGAGSAGILLASALDVAGTLALSSGGAVRSNGAPMSAGSLLLHGARPESGFQLSFQSGQAGNRFGSVAAVFDAPKSLASSAHGDVDLAVDGALLFAPGSWTGFSTASPHASTISVADTVVAGDLLARAGGAITLRQNLSTLGSDITLVTGTQLQNPDAHTLTPGADGAWRVFADSWVGETRGGLRGTSPLPNLYGCSFGAACANLAGNHFFYRAQPQLVLQADLASRLYGGADPVFSFGAAGLVNGDSLGEAASGAYASGAGPRAGVGSYAIDGSFISPAGYRLTVLPGVLTVLPAPLRITANNATIVSGAPVPAFSVTYDGFVNGEGSGVVSGLSVTAPGAAFGAAGSLGGDFAITPGNASAANYAISYVPGTLRVLASPLAVRPVIARDISFESSYLYEKNVGQTRMCVGTGPLIAGTAAGGADMLGVEWSRVRISPNLSSCLALGERNSCSDF